MIITTEDEHIAFCFDDRPGRANARLIAAAPDLLDACKAAYADIHSDCTEDGCSDLCRLLADVLAKAGGGEETITPADTIDQGEDERPCTVEMGGPHFHIAATLPNRNVANEFAQWCTAMFEIEP